MSRGTDANPATWATSPCERNRSTIPRWSRTSRVRECRPPAREPSRSRLSAAFDNSDIDTSQTQFTRQHQSRRTTPNDYYCVLCHDIAPLHTWPVDRSSDRFGSEITPTKDTSARPVFGSQVLPTGQEQRAYSHYSRCVLTDPFVQRTGGILHTETPCGKPPSSRYSLSRRRSETDQRAAEHFRVLSSILSAQRARSRCSTPHGSCF